MTRLLNGSDVIVVHSGGSMALPKTVIRPVRTWVESARIEAQMFGLSASERFAVIGSDSHSLWRYAQFRATLIGSDCIGVDQVNVESLSLLISKRVTVVYAVPDPFATASRLLWRQSIQAPSVRLLLLGGGGVASHFPVEVIRQVFPNATVRLFYGSAEASFVGFGDLSEVYQPFPGVQIDIRTDGEIRVRSPMTVRPSDWVVTGDLACWVADSRFKLIGRANRQLEVKGQKYPVEPMERKILERFGYQKIALVQDDLCHVVCVVSTDGDPPTRAAVNHAIKAEDPGFPIARRVVLVPPGDWPTTPSGKTDWVAVRRVAGKVPT